MNEFLIAFHNVLQSFNPRLVLKCPYGVLLDRCLLRIYFSVPINQVLGVLRLRLAFFLRALIPQFSYGARDLRVHIFLEGLGATSQRLDLLLLDIYNLLLLL